MTKIPPRKRKTARSSLRRICRKLGLRFTVKRNVDHNGETGKTE